MATVQTCAKAKVREIIYCIELGDLVTKKSFSLTLSMIFIWFYVIVIVLCVLDLKDQFGKVYEAKKYKEEKCCWINSC